MLQMNPYPGQPMAAPHDSRRHGEGFMPAPPPTITFFCNKCRKDRTRSFFTKSQVNKKATQRKCLECVKEAGEKKEVAKPVATGDDKNNTVLPSAAKCGPGETYCNACQKAKPTSAFSNRQLHGSAARRKCKGCVPTNNAVTTKCSICKKMLPRNNFSKKQLSQAVANRKCVACVGTQLGQPLLSEYHCTMCDKSLPRIQFSATEIRGPAPQRKCQKCAPASAASSPKVESIDKFKCSVCLEEKSRILFTKTQLSHPVAKRKCRPCAEKTVAANLANQNVTKKVGVTHRQGFLIFHECRGCQKKLPKKEFSRSQLSHPVWTRKCRNCVTNLVSSPPNAGGGPNISQNSGESNHSQSPAGTKRKANFVMNPAESARIKKQKNNPPAGQFAAQEHVTMGTGSTNSSFNYAPIPPGFSRGKQDIVK